ncbi:MAG TPA: EAL domain-containing protein [Pseudorhodoferax sp.]|nr:EAL domain-containing protein [Pseudorhodoferax sp.]
MTGSAHRDDGPDAALARAVLALWPEPALVTDARHRIRAANAAFTEAFGYPAQELLGRDARQLLCTQACRTELARIRRGLQQAGVGQGQARMRGREGQTLSCGISLHAAPGTGLRIVRLAPAPHLPADALAHAAGATQRDRLTGLLDRAGLLAALASCVALASAQGTRLAVLVLDLDNFKAVNKTLGHAAGELLLASVAQRLRPRLGTGSIGARLGGDAFCVVLPLCEDLATAQWEAGQLLAAVSGRYRIDSADLHASACVGMAMFPDHGTDGASLLRNAESAMHHAKGGGRGHLQVYMPSVQPPGARKLALDHALRMAFEARALELHYQPQFDGRTGKITGVEALLRWRSDDGRYIPPDEFIPVAEEGGLIVRLGAWVLDEACRQLAAWRAAGLPRMTVAVNVSAHELRSKALLSHVMLTLDRHGLDGSDLELEITESAAMAKPETSIGMLRALRQLGVRLLIDDFGTGYSSLSYLTRLPIHALKLDRSFVHGIGTDAHGGTLCTATIGLAHTLGLDIVAEGVETPGQHDFLARHACDRLQGYLFARPMPADALHDFVCERMALPH